MSNAKVVDVVFYDGTLDGVVKLSSSNGNDAVVISSPRSKIDQLLGLQESNYFGVYLLLSDDVVYIGQAKELKRRIKEHVANKDWWKRVILLSTTSNRLDSSDIDYLEAELITLAKETKLYKVENIQKGNTYNIKESNRIVLDGYMNEINFLLDFISVNVFNSVNASTNAQRTNLVSNKVLHLTQRSYASRFMKEKFFGNNQFSYAKRADKENKYAIDPQEKLLKDNWYIGLNDVVQYVIYMIEVPKTALTNEVLNNFKKRNSHQFRLMIDGETFVERNGFDFSKYIKYKIPYDEI